MEWLIPLVVGIVIGSVLTWILASAQTRRAIESSQLILREQLERRAVELENKEKQFAELRILYEDERASHANAESELRHSRENLTDLKKTIEEIQINMKGHFAKLSQDALAANSSAFTESAKELLKDARTALGEKKQEIEVLLQPLSETLARYERSLLQIEESRQKAYGSLEEKLKSVDETAKLLQRETGSLVTALRRPQVRGRWGEIQLRNAAEISGMSEYCDFQEQVAISGEERGWRPDMIVRTPGEQEIVVDSKVSLDAYLDYATAQSEADREDALRRHARQLRDHVSGLSKQEYWKQRVSSPEYVVMFVPGESMFAAALTADATLFESALRQNVIIATPATFIALLRTIAMGWRRERLERNATEIRDLGQELHDRVATFAEHLVDVGSRLGSAVGAYNRAVASFQTRLTQQIGRFTELGVAPKKEMPDLKTIDEQPNALLLNHERNSNR